MYNDKCICICIQIPDWLAANKHHIPSHILLCNTAKGLYVKDNSLLSEALFAAIGRNQPYAVLSGPSFATEIIDNVPTAGIYYTRMHIYILCIA